MERIETTILRNLVFNEEYARKTIPFIQSDFFEERSEKIIFDEIVSFITKYDSCVTTEALNIEVENRTDLTCLLYTSPSPRDLSTSRMPSSA